MNKQEKECLEYFRQDMVWEKLFRGFREKYVSYGGFMGNVRLTALSASDIEALEGFFGRNYHGRKSVSVSADRFRKALKESRYSEITPDRLLELYFAHKIVGKKEQEETFRRDKEQIQKEFEKQYEKMLSKEQLSLLVQTINIDKEKGLAEWKSRLQLSAEIVNAFPYRNGKVMYLAVFATTVTGNPHAFDKGTPGGKLLSRLVNMDLEFRGILVSDSEIFHSYKRQKSYLETGIMIDDVSNYAMLYGVLAWNKDGSIHQGMEGFCRERDMVQIPLAAIMKWGKLSCPHKEIYIVENPSVYAILCGKADEDKAYMCMNGQPRLASLVILELLAKEGTTVYYAGDFDPEGLLIAWKLSLYYKGEFHYWHMTKEDYITCQSEEPISEKRLKMLDKITDERLRPLADEIMICKKAGYQEKLKIPSIRASEQ